MRGAVVFRVDASVSMGAGHVVRCLALAAGLDDAGWRCVFVMRAGQGDMTDAVMDGGHEVFAVRLGEDDAAATAEIARQTGAKWAVIDHYGLDARWAARLDASAQVMVVDDLADRPHACDVLLDSTPGRRAEDYDGLVPGGARRLIGPAYALLRPEFARLAAAVKRPASRPVRRVLIAMGGMDHAGATGETLSALERLPAMKGAGVTVVLGRHAPALDRVRAQAAASALDVNVRVDVKDMAALMDRADIAIGAGGGTALERLCLGLPSVIVTVADNQHGAARAIADAGAAALAGDVRSAGWKARLSEAMACLLRDGAARAAMARAGAAMVDGRGVARCVEAMNHA
jgi:UDP-2,4-diacetamido-2,4,6-trideoxy-beta-L-altropyranose hydrolase